MATPANLTTGLGAQVLAMFDALLAGDLDTLSSLLHPDLEVIEPESLPYGGVYRGPDAFLGDLLVQMTRAFELGLEDARVIDGGDVVAAQMTCVFTSRKTGQALRIPYVEVYEFEDGLIRTVTVYPSDTKVMADFMAANA